MEQIRKYLESNVHLTESDWKIFSSKFVKQRFLKKTILLKAGQVENYLSYIKKGIIRYYIPDAKKDQTFAFAFDNEFVCAYGSFLKKTPAKFSIETLTETVLWRLTYEDLQIIYNKTKVGNFIGRKASEDLYLKKCSRELSLLFDTAEERYLKIFSEEPYLIKRIPLKYIASYIGVTPQALSRIRKRIF